MQKLVMVVDDSATIRRAVELVFRATDYSVETFAGAEEALRRLDEATPSILLIDAAMDGIDGFEMCRQLLERDLGVPVLLMVGADNPDVARVEEAEVDGYVLKPFGANELLDPVRMLTGASITRDQPLTFQQQLEARRLEEAQREQRRLEAERAAAGILVSARVPSQVSKPDEPDPFDESAWVRDDDDTRASKLKADREREAKEREAKQREAREREAKEREAKEREARERSDRLLRELQERQEREAREARDRLEREARERGERAAREREAKQREALELEAREYEERLAQERLAGEQVTPDPHALQAQELAERDRRLDAANAEDAAVPGESDEAARAREERKRLREERELAELAAMESEARGEREREAWESREREVREAREAREREEREALARSPSAVPMAEDLDDFGASAARERRPSLRPAAPPPPQKPKSVYDSKNFDDAEDETVAAMETPESSSMRDADEPMFVDPLAASPRSVDADGDEPLGSRSLDLGGGARNARAVMVSGPDDQLPYENAEMVVERVTGGGEDEQVAHESGDLQPSSLLHPGYGEQTPVGRVPQAEPEGETVADNSGEIAAAAAAIAIQRAHPEDDDNLAEISARDSAPVQPPEEAQQDVEIIERTSGNVSDTGEEGATAAESEPLVERSAPRQSGHGITPPYRPPPPPRHHGERDRSKRDVPVKKTAKQPSPFLMVFLLVLLAAGVLIALALTQR